MLYQTAILSIAGLFFLLGAFETNLGSQDTAISCSCKKKKKNNLKSPSLVACAAHDEEPLEEETV